MAESLDYIPMPDAVVGLIHDEWKDKIKDMKGKPVW